jgi:hypothetical protein
MLTIAIASYAMGAAGIFVAIFGGGIEAKEIKIPPLSQWARILCAAFGCILIGVGLAEDFLRAQYTETPQLNREAPSETARKLTPPSIARRDNFAIALIAVSTPLVAQENVAKAKLFAPEGAKIDIYKRGQLFAVIVN